MTQAAAEEAQRKEAEAAEEAKKQRVLQKQQELQREKVLRLLRVLPGPNFPPMYLGIDGCVAI